MHTNRYKTARRVEQKSPVRVTINWMILPCPARISFGQIVAQTGVNEKLPLQVWPHQTRLVKHCERNLVQMAIRTPDNTGSGTC